MIINKESGITIWESKDFDVEYYQRIIDKYNIGQDATILTRAIS